MDNKKYGNIRVNAGHAMLTRRLCTVKHHGKIRHPVDTARAQFSKVLLGMVMVRLYCWSVDAGDFMAANNAVKAFCIGRRQLAIGTFTIQNKRRDATVDDKKGPSFCSSLHGLKS